jgi:hypothetical protein
VVRKTNAFGVQTAIVGVAGVAIGIEGVGASGKKMLEKIVLRRNARTDVEASARAIHQRGQAPKAADRSVRPTWINLFNAAYKVF